MRSKVEKHLFITIILLLLLSFCSTVTASGQVPPKPDRYDYVFDYARMMEEQDAAKIRSIGAELENKTKAQVIVLIVESLEGIPIEDYANTIFRSWGIGTAEKNNGILILVNKENVVKGVPQRVRIEVGYGLEGAVTDGAAGRILDERVLPNWQEKQYSAGIVQGYAAVSTLVAKEYNVTLEGGIAPPPPRSSVKPLFGLSAPVLGLIVAVSLFLFFSGIFPRRRRRGPWDDDDDSFGGGRFGGGGWGGFGGGGFGGGGGGFGGGSSGGGGAGR